MNQKDIDRFWSKVDKRGDDECWEWKGSRRKDFPYGEIHLGGRKGRAVRAHRVAYELTFGKIPEGMNVCHRCDNPPCCNPSHLFLGTHHDNVLDKERKGRGNHQSGEKSGRWKLSDAQVKEIRQRYATGQESTIKISRDFPVSHQHIWEIVANKSRNSS